MHDMLKRFTKLLLFVKVVKVFKNFYFCLFDRLTLKLQSVDIYLNSFECKDC
jgi:hypothetical protein